MKCGLLGRTLAHSYSPQIHSYLGKYSYELFEQEPENVREFLNNSDFTAINVTIPYKKDVMPYCAELTDCAKKMGAVNTIIRRPDGKLIGHNTDYFGLHYTFQRMGIVKYLLAKFIFIWHKKTTINYISTFINCIQHS